ncbi:efflux RND transporter permease subunit [Clostridium sp. P21]|uniref:Efflux RND transporter permease subunit n=1 Tax=Clostridium muellerianum TaxID=2716538 RepID=A0A7Y0EGV8_9CLOT|nr:efflux RND transporter permease subunit [Clostridium muellerianum]NMM62230.1 efflux RND transporter permease subunit [Clostridium muellerianum]
MNIANISIKRPVLITVIMIALTILGFTNYQKLVLNDMPEADMPYVSVVVTERGATPQELETKVTKKVEDAVQKISGVDTITSTVTEGVSQTTIGFDLSKNSDIAAQEVRDKVSSIKGQLPTDTDDPVISKIDMSASSIVSIAVYGLDDNKKLSDIIDNTIKPKLYTVSGIGSVDVSGEDTREIHVKLDNSKLLQYGLTSSQIVNSIKTDNIDQSSGKVSTVNNEIAISTNSKIQKVEDFKNILIAKKNGSEIRLKDIAKVEDAIEDKTSLAFYQRNESIGIDIVKQSGANTVEVAKNVKKVVNEVKTSLPESVHIDIVSDNSKAIQSTVEGVNQTIIEGCVLAVLIVFLFLHEWESTFISGLSLPISIITTFICMKIMNFSLNTMSLTGLSLAVGLLIDDAIVVIENIVSHLHKGKGPIEAARDATSEIGFAVIATTSAVIAVFLPIAMIEGILGKYFIEFALTIVFSMVVSLFVSFTLVPMMSSKMLKGGKKESKTFVGKFFEWFNEMFDSLAEKYSHLLIKTLNHRLLVLIACVAMFAASIILATSLGFSMIPSSDNNKITVNADFDSGMTLDVASRKNKQLEEIIKSKHPEVEGIYSAVSKSKTSIKLELIDKKNRKNSSREIAEMLRTDLHGIPGAKVTVSASSIAGGGGTSKDITYNLVSEDREKLQVFAEKIKKELAEDPNSRDVSSNNKSGAPQVEIEVDRDKAADLGVNSADVASTLYTLFNGSTVTKYDGGTDRYNVKVSLDEGQRKNIGNLDEIYISGSNNAQIPLTQVTKKVVGTTLSELHRYGKQAQVEISCNVSGISTGTFENKYLQKIKSNLPEGVSLSVGGMNQQMQKSVASLIQSIGLAVLFLYLVMAAQFESFIDPISILFALPLAIIGAMIGLFVFGSDISMTALLGIVMLMGLVSKNGILLVDAAKAKIQEGIPRNEALKEAGLTRLRPIIMTTLAMVFGMFPSAVSKSLGSEMTAPMAQVVIGGLITATILTLVVVPIAYTLLDDLKRKFKRFGIKTRKANVEESNLNL